MPTTEMNDIFSKDRIQEYLYIDRNRLDSYVSQFSTLVSFLKTVKSIVSLAITGPSVELQQDRHPVGLDDHNKVLLLIHRLRKSRQITDMSETPGYGATTRDKEFVLGQMRARRIVVLGHSTSSPMLGSVAIWISAVLPDRLRLVLVEDYPNIDRRGVEATSSFTLLEMLMREMKGRLRRTILLDPETLELAAGDGIVENMGKDPIETLRQLGCHIGDERTIGFLARKRLIFHETWVQGEPELHTNWTIFGYPIAIVEKMSMA